MDAASMAFNRAFPPSKDKLGIQAEKSRVKSEDLSQEAEGLLQNAVDMKYRLDKVRNEWKEQSVLIEQYLRNLGMMKREMNRR